MNTAQQPTLAEQFCKDQDAQCYLAPYFGVDTYAHEGGEPSRGPTWEGRFADGSYACSVDGKIYEPRRLRLDEIHQPYERADRVGLFLQEQQVSGVPRHQLLADLSRLTGGNKDLEAYFADQLAATAQ